MKVVVLQWRLNSRYCKEILGCFSSPFEARMHVDKVKQNYDKKGEFIVSDFFILDAIKV